MKNSIYTIAKGKGTVAGQECDDIIGSKDLYDEEYDSPVAGWCRIFRNFSIFARTAAAKGSWFKELGGAMRIRGLSDEQIESYFSDMISKEELQPYLEGSELQGYRMGPGDIMGMRKSGSNSQKLLPFRCNHA